MLLKNFILNSTHHFIMKIPNKREFQQIAFNHLSCIDYEDFMNFYKKSTSKSYTFLLVLLLQQISLYISERIF